MLQFRYNLPRLSSCTTYLQTWAAYAGDLSDGVHFPPRGVVISLVFSTTILSLSLEWSVYIYIYIYWGSQVGDSIWFDFIRQWGVANSAGLRLSVRVCVRVCMHA